MFFDFHTHNPCINALVSSVEKPADCPYWSLEQHPWNLPAEPALPEHFFSDLEEASALGEMGLDRLRGVELDIQRRYLRLLLEAAETYRKPVVIHCVRCDSELDTELKNFSGRVLIHGFCGGEKKLAHHLEQGRFVSLAPGAWRKLAAFLRSGGLDRVGLETDDSSLEIRDIYQQAESETGIAGWEEACAKNFLQFIGLNK